MKYDDITPYYEKTFERHRRDIEAVEKGEKQNLRFNKKIGMAYVAILQTFKHYKGDKAKEFIILEWWQKKAVIIWGGWEKKNSDGKWVRRFGESFWFLPKKNGKTILGSGLAIADSIIRGEYGGEVYSFATKEEQAKLAWVGFDELLKNHDELKNYRELAYSTLTLTKNKTTFKALGRDSKTLDGINASFGLADERHAHPDNSVRDNVKSSMAARKQPHMMDITTAGFNLAGPCFADYEHAKGVVEGIKEDDDLFVFIAEAPEKPEGKEYEDWYFREEVWRAANPNYGVSVDRDFLETQAKKAKERPEKLNAFLAKHLNVWSNAPKSYISFEDWKRNAHPYRDVSSAFGKLLGVDLSLHDDFTAKVKTYLMPDGSKHITSHFYIPADNVVERGRELQVQLTKWVLEGYVTATPGAVIDLDYIERDIIADIEAEQIGELGYDPYRAATLIANIEKRTGFEGAVQVRQGSVTLSEPTVQFKNDIRTGRLTHDNNPCMNWMVSNLTVLTDSNGNVKPDKSNPNRKIDGCAAAINTYACAVRFEPPQESVYEHRGIRSLD